MCFSIPYLLISHEALWDNSKPANKKPHLRTEDGVSLFISFSSASRLSTTSWTLGFAPLGYPRFTLIGNYFRLVFSPILADSCLIVKKIMKKLTIKF